MLQFEEYKVKLNNLKPELEALYGSLGLEQAKREVEELPEAYIIPVAEYLATQEEATNE